MHLAVDPGLNTGIAFRFNNQAWGTLTIPNMPDAAERLQLVLDTILERVSDGCDGIVIEAFVTMGYLSKYGIETIELVGALKAVCKIYSVPFAKQMPIQRMSMERTAHDMLKSRGGRFTDHEVSALAHLLYYERTHNLSPDVPAAPPPTPTTTAPAIVKVTRKRLSI